MDIVTKLDGNLRFEGNTEEFAEFLSEQSALPHPCFCCGRTANVMFMTPLNGDFVPGELSSNVKLYYLCTWCVLDPDATISLIETDLAVSRSVPSPQYG